MDPTLSTYQRIYLQLKRGDAGKVRMVFSRLKPESGGAMVALLSRGSILSDGMEVQLVSDPSADPALRGKDGTNGTNGTNGRDGVDGKNGVDGKAGTNGIDGQSAYDIAKSLGYSGTKAQFIASLVGAGGKDGKDGSNGSDGRSASALLGTVNLGQTATVAISAGTRRLPITIPAGWGVVAGDALMALPSATIAGYAIHDVVAVSPTSISVGFTAPLLAIGASFTIPLRIARLNP